MGNYAFRTDFPVGGDINNHALALFIYLGSLHPNYDFRLVLYKEQNYIEAEAMAASVYLIRRILDKKIVEIIDFQNGPKGPARNPLKFRCFDSTLLPQETLVELVNAVEDMVCTY